MIKHIVMWHLKDEAQGNTKAANAQLIKSKLEALNGVVPGLIELEVGIDFSQGDMSADVVLYSVLESEDALSTYQQHPAHQEAVQFIGSVIEKRQLVDYKT
jgi:Stress responsive A/B Barrel Domain